MTGASTHRLATSAMRVTCMTMTVWVAMMAWARPASALMFKEEQVGKSLVLWVYDCGLREEPRTCLPEQTSFKGEGDYSAANEPDRPYPGDAAMLRRLLERKRAAGGYAEIRLWSGGGNLMEGVELGRVLRQYQATVHVVRGTSCVSACTVAFMGGLFRFVDPGGSYEVHAYSRWLSGFSGQSAQRTRDRLLIDTAGELARVVHAEQNGVKGGQMGAREWASILVPYFQEGLLPLGRTPGNDARLKRWLATPAAPLYEGSAQLQMDADRIMREGETAAHEVLMRIERDAMAAAIAELRKILPELGPRAEPALNMLESMFSSRIVLTAELSQETMLKMGYITRIFNPQQP
jgi:hypothetical protein